MEENNQFTPENTIGFHIDTDLLNDIKNGTCDFLEFDINDDTYPKFLENIDGNLILTTEEMPLHFYGCYMWNKGIFPYMFNSSLNYLMLTDNTETIVCEIIDRNAVPSKRFSINFEKGTHITDCNGDCCVWKIKFNLKVIGIGDNSDAKPTDSPTRTYIMRWNPAISSFSIDEYYNAIKKFPNGFNFNWSIYEWEGAQEGDEFYMMRVGEGDTGIMFRGELLTAPYPGDDWAGKGKKRYYVDISCYDFNSDGSPRIKADELNAVIPDINWLHGHSGELISEEVATELLRLWNK